jgi:hypothetical protein
MHQKNDTTSRLPWGDIIKVCDTLNTKYISAEVNSTERARALMRYLVKMQPFHAHSSNKMVGFYVYFPPVRAGPIRQLTLDESLSLVKGKWYLDLRKVGNIGCSHG